jgi:hypothetical protein
MKKSKQIITPTYELAVVENIDGGFASTNSHALYAAELRIIPTPGGACIRFSTVPSKNKADAELAHSYLSKLIAPKEQT